MTVPPATVVASAAPPTIAVRTRLLRHWAEIAVRAAADAWQARARLLELVELVARPAAASSSAIQAALPASAPGSSGLTRTVRWPPPSSRSVSTSNASRSPTLPSP